VALFVCHCRECRKQSASAFGMSLVVPGGRLRVTSGAPKFWSRDADSGLRIRSAFCPSCGSRLWDEPDPDTLVIKAGSLDEPVDISTAAHIWTRRALPGTIIPADTRQYPKEPE
jgi:hypothetical protein